MPTNIGVDEAQRLVHEDDALLIEVLPRGYEGLADLDEGERLAKVLGTHDVMFLRHHGILVAGRGLGAAIDDLYMLEKAAQLQVLASGLGKPTPIPTETIEKTRGQFSGDGMRDWGRMHWAALLRMLEKTQPDFKDWVRDPPGSAEGGLQHRMLG